MWWTRQTLRAAVLAGACGLAGLLAVGSLVASAAGQEKKGDGPDVKVRHLKVGKVPFNLGGGSEVKVAASAEDLTKLAGEQIAAELGKQVDFTKEVVAFVSWNTGGPPFGKLAHQVKGRQVEFYVAEPKLPPGSPRGGALRLGADFFAVSKGVKVTFGGTR
jgi:hypothetical protein